MPGKLYNTIYSLIILLLLAHACVGVASFTSQYTHGFDRLQVLASPWSPSTNIRSTTQTMAESHSQPSLKYKRGVIANRAPHEIPVYLTEPSSPELVPVASPPGENPVHSVSTSAVAASQQLSSLNIPQATPPPPAAAVVTLITSTNDAANPTNLPGNTASVPAAESDHVTPVGFSQVSAVVRQSTAHPPESSNGIPDRTNLVLAPGKTQPAPNSRGTTSPALAAASEDGKSVGMPRTLKTSLSPTSERAFAVPGTDQTSMPPSMIPTTAPAIPTVIGSAHNADPASQRIENGRPLNLSETARGSAGISSVGFMDGDTSRQKLSTAANITANVTAPSRTLLIVSSTSSVANRTTVSVASTVVTQISSSSSASLFSAGTTATSPATISSSSNAVGLQFPGAKSPLRGLEMVRLLGCLAVCMMVGARILV